MNANRRKLLGAIGATSVVGAIAVGKTNAQSPKPPQTVSSPSATPANRELIGKVAIVTGARNNLGRGYAIALAWLLAKGEDIIPIPGMKRQARLNENVGAVKIALTADELQQIEAVVPIGSAAGTCYPKALMHSVNR